MKVSLSNWIFSLAVFLVASTASAQSGNTAYKAAVAKLVISEWGAYPIFIDKNADSGTFYRISNLSQERQSSRGTACFLERPIEPAAQFGSRLIETTQNFDSSAGLGVPLRQLLADVGLDAAVARNNNLTLRLDNIETEGPWAEWVYLQSNNVRDDPACDDVRAFVQQGGTGLLGFRAIKAGHRMEITLTGSQAATVEAELKKKDDTIAQVNVGLQGEQVRFLLIEAPKSTIGLQPTHLDARRVAEIFAYFTDDPDSYVELQMLVDGYLTNSDPSLAEEFTAGLLGWFERHGWREETLDEFVDTLFTGEDASSISQLFEINEFPSRAAFETVGYLAAANLIVAEGE
ncbi:MAG: hypothetical protein AAGK92_15950 [Pseudomonadota bacterium]